MFSKFYRGPLRFILLPFSLLYWLGIGIRNWLYDRQILRSSEFGLPVICVGNLSVGGTGKSPMVEYLVERLKNDYRVATLSRGYKRKTRGYALAGAETTALDIGDEPMQFHLKFPEVSIAVGEKRIEAIPQLLHDRPETEVIILDDAFQHRSIRAGMNILLTEKDRLFTHDFYLPAGNLRDQKRSHRRAQVIVITKCPGSLSEEESRKLRDEIRPRENQHVYFTTLEYGRISHLINGNEWRPGSNSAVLMVTGIANPEPLQQHIGSLVKDVEVLKFADHHIYTIDDLKTIRERLTAMKPSDKIILTTEKDAVRLDKFRRELHDIPFYVIPVQHKFLFGAGRHFESEVRSFIERSKRSDMALKAQTVNN